MKDTDILSYKHLRASLYEIETQYLKEDEVKKIIEKIQMHKDVLNHRHIIRGKELYKVYMVVSLDPSIPDKELIMKELCTP